MHVPLFSNLPKLMSIYPTHSVQVPNPSGANDEGITALHNAICASHYQIVNFLILKGVDVNSPDSDGW